MLTSWSQRKTRPKTIEKTRSRSKRGDAGQNLVHKGSGSSAPFFCRPEMVAPIRPCSVNTELIHRMNCLEQKFCIHEDSVDVHKCFTSLLLQKKKPTQCTDTFEYKMTDFFESVHHFGGCGNSLSCFERKKMPYLFTSNPRPYVHDLARHEDESPCWIPRRAHTMKKILGNSSTRTQVVLHRYPLDLGNTSTFCLPLDLYIFCFWSLSHLSKHRTESSKTQTIAFAHCQYLRIVLL